MNSHNCITCPYCNKVCTKVQRKRGSKVSQMYQPPFVSRRLSFQCSNCSTAYLTKLNGQIERTAFKYTDNEKKFYLATVYWNRPYTSIECYDWHDVHDSYLSYIIYQADCAIQFRPCNLKYKLTTILTFL